MVTIVHGDHGIACMHTLGIGMCTYAMHMAYVHMGIGYTTIGVCLPYLPCLLAYGV